MKLALIVDDDHDFVDYLKEVLGFLDVEFELIVAYNGSDAITQIKNNIDVLSIIFLDMRLPDVEGVVIYEETRKLSTSVPVVFISGLPLAEITDDEKLYFLPKPISFEDMSILIECLGF